MAAPAEPDTVVVDYCGQTFVVPGSRTLTIGRDADVSIDDNPYLHRRFLELSFHDGLLWLANIGSSATATVSDDAGLAQSWLAPGARLPIVFPHTSVRFTAGPTTYEFEIFNRDAPFITTAQPDTTPGDTTIGRLSLTPDQRLLLVALAEDLLRRGTRGSGVIPRSAVAADRLGWTITKFNRKLDNVCEKFSKVGVRGLVADADGSATNRRARLVEYALAARLVTGDDLYMLDDRAP